MKQERGSIGVIVVILFSLFFILIVLGLTKVLGGKTQVTLNSGVTVTLTGSRLTPENNSELRQVRSDSISKIDDYFQEIEAATNMKISTYISTDEYCNYGANGWKRSDPYKEQCEIQKTKYYGFDGDFAITMTALHKKLVELGWNEESTQNSLQWLIEEYYNPRKGTINDRGKTFDVSELPGVFSGYLIGESEIGIAFAERSTNLEFDPFNNSNSLMVKGALFTEYYRNEDLVDYRLPVKELTEASEYVMAFSISDKYYQK